MTETLPHPGPLAPPLVVHGLAQVGERGRGAGKETAEGVLREVETLTYLRVPTPLKPFKGSQVSRSPRVDLSQYSMISPHAHQSKHFHTCDGLCHSRCLNAHCLTQQDTRCAVTLLQCGDPEVRMSSLPPLLALRMTTERK